MAALQKSTTAAAGASTVKFLYSYGGKIVPRPSDACLRYVGGHIRVLSIHRSVSFSELIAKLTELCGHSVVLRCQLPSEDMDVLVSIKSDEDLASVIEEYDRASLVAGREMKIRAILSPPNPIKDVSSSSPSSSSSLGADLSPTKSVHSDRRHFHNSAALKMFPRPVSAPAAIGSLSASTSTACRGYSFAQNCHQQRCHMQAHYRRPSCLVSYSNYRQ